MNKVLLAGLLCLLPFLLLAQSVNSLDTKNIVELECVQSPTTNTLVVCTMENQENGDTRALLHRSTDLGISWQRIDSVEVGSNDIAIADPVITVDEQGYFYMVLMRVHLGGEPFQSDLELYRSTDDGMSFQLMSKPHKDDGVADYPQIVQINGVLYLCYTRIIYSGNDTDFKTLFRKSTDQGISWSPAYEFATTGSKGPDLLVQTDNSLLLSFGDNANAVLAYSSEDFGESWTAVAQLTLPLQEDGHITKPITTQTTAGIGFFSHQPHQDDTRIMYHAYRENTWQTDFFDWGAYVQAHVTDDGTMHVIYNQLQEDIFQLLYATSNNNGEDFSTPIVLYSGPITGTGKGEYQSFFMGNDGQFYLAFCDWADDSRAKMLVFSPTITSTQNRVANQFDIFPNPSNGVYTLQLPDNHQLEYIEVYDLNGHKIKEYPIPTHQQELQIDITDMPSGKYLVRGKEAYRWLVGSLIKQ